MGSSRGRKACGHCGKMLNDGQYVFDNYEGVEFL